MDIKEFIAETLSQITDSIINNPSSLNPDDLESYDVNNAKKVATVVNGGFLTSVEFDVAVTESSTKDGGAKLSIAGIGSLGGELAQNSQTVSRVKFTVPLHIEPKYRKLK